MVAARGDCALRGGGGSGPSGELIGVETGKGADALERRSQLREAPALAKRLRAAVCIAKLDRLSRDVAFLTGLMAQRVRTKSRYRAWSAGVIQLAPRFRLIISLVPKDHGERQVPSVADVGDR
jgi:hypothetical protein